MNPNEGREAAVAGPESNIHKAAAARCLAEFSCKSKNEKRIEKGTLQMLQKRTRTNKSQSYQAWPPNEARKKLLTSKLQAQDVAQRLLVVPRNSQSLASEVPANQCKTNGTVACFCHFRTMGFAGDQHRGAYPDSWPPSRNHAKTGTWPTNRNSY